MFAVSVKMSSFLFWKGDSCQVLEYLFLLVDPIYNLHWLPEGEECRFHLGENKCEQELWKWPLWSVVSSGRPAGVIMLFLHLTPLSLKRGFHSPQGLLKKRVDALLETLKGGDWAQLWSWGPSVKEPYWFLYTLSVAVTRGDTHLSRITTVLERWYVLLLCKRW